MAAICPNSDAVWHRFPCCERAICDAATLYGSEATCAQLDMSEKYLHIVRQSVMGSLDVTCRADGWRVRWRCYDVHALLHYATMFAYAKDICMFCTLSTVLQKVISCKVVQLQTRLRTTLFDLTSSLRCRSMYCFLSFIALVYLTLCMCIQCKCIYKNCSHVQWNEHRCADAMRCSFHPRYWHGSGNILVMIQCCGMSDMFQCALVHKSRLVLTVL